MLILADGEWRGYYDQCPILRHWGRASMVPGWYQGGTRVPPVKCLGKTGPGRCCCHSKCLYCSGGCSGRRTSARAQTSKEERRMATAEWAGEATQSHLQAIYKPFASQPQATHMRPPYVPQATFERRQKQEGRMQKTSTELPRTTPTTAALKLPGFRTCESCCQTR